MVGIGGRADMKGRAISAHSDATYPTETLVVRRNDLLRRSIPVSLRCLVLSLGMDMNRRKFLGALGGAAAAPALLSPSGVLAQQAMPVIGFLYNTSPDPIADRLRAFRQGLKETAYVEGDNVTILYRFADNQNERMPDLAAELVRRRVGVIVAPNNVSALAAKAATVTIPVVFAVNE